MNNQFIHYWFPQSTDHHKQSHGSVFLGFGNKTSRCLSSLWITTPRVTRPVCF